MNLGYVEPTFESNPTDYCLRNGADPRCGPGAVVSTHSLPPNFSPNWGRGGHGEGEDVGICRDISLLMSQRDPIFHPTDTRKIDKRIKQLRAQLKKLQRRLHMPQVACALSGLGELADLGVDAPAIIDSTAQGIINVMNTIRPKPTPKPEHEGFFSNIDWTTVAVATGVLVGGAVLLKKFGKKKRR